MTIRKVDNEFCVFSEDGSRSFGCYDSSSQAEDRLEQVEFFKKKENAYPEDEAEFKRCWEGYEPVPGKKPYAPGSCRKIGSDKEFGDVVELKEDEKADKPLNKPFRLPKNSSKKFGVYVRDGDKIKKITFGDPNMEIRRDDDEARASFRARHNCDTADDKTSARYWSCRMWEADSTVSEATKERQNPSVQIKSSLAYGVSYKQEKDALVVKGYVATTHLDSGSDKITRSALESWATELNEGVPRANKATLYHDRDDKVAIGVAVKGTARVDALPDGEYGLYVETRIDNTHELYPTIKSRVENDMLDSFSIEYMTNNPDGSDIHGADYAGTMDGRQVRFLDAGTQLYGYTLTSRPMNEHAVMVKELLVGIDTKPIEEKTMAIEEKMPKMTEEEQKKFDAMSEEEQKAYLDKRKKMAEDKKEESADVVVEHKQETKVEVDYKSLAQEILSSKDVKEAVHTMEVKNEVLVNDAPAVEVKEDKTVTEYKQAADFTNRLSTQERLLRATRMAFKSGLLQHTGNGVQVNSGVNLKKFAGNVEFKNHGFSTNTTSYTQAPAELRDVYDPIIQNGLNDTVSLYTRVPKKNMRGQGTRNYSFIMRNARNSTASSYSGNQVQTGTIGRDKFETRFKKYQAGVAVDGDFLIASEGAYVEAFSQAVSDSMLDLMKKINQDMYLNNGLETADQVIGLNYLANSSTNGTLYGITRTSANLLAPDAAGDTYINGSSANVTIAQMRQAIRQLTRDGSRREAIVAFASPTQIDKIKALYDNAQRLVPVSSKFGFEGQIEFEGVPVVEDIDALDASGNEDSIFFVDMDSYGVAEFFAPSLEMLGKRSDAEEGFIKTYLAAYSRAPRRIVQIYDLATS